MTKDYTKIVAPPGAATEQPLASNQRVALMAIRYCGMALIGAGGWLVVGGTSPFPPESTALIGYALTATGVMDVLIAAFLRRQWAKRTPQ